MGRKLRVVRNPGDLEYGQWIPAHAVKFNEDGSVSMMAEGGGRQQNIAGYRDPMGYFHPIRWDPRYKGSKLSERESKRYSTHPTAKFRRMQKWQGPKPATRKRAAAKRRR